MDTKRGVVRIALLGAALAAAGCHVTVQGGASGSAGTRSSGGAATTPPQGSSTTSSTTTETVQREPTAPPPAAPPPRRRRETAFGSTGRMDQALVGNIYFLPPRTRRLPDFDTLESEGTVYARSIDIAPRRFDEGFPGISDRVEWFAVRYEGTVFIENAGEYGFRLHSDDGARLYIDGELVVDNDGQHAPQSREGTARLGRGNHRFVIEYFQGPRYQIALQLFWTPPGGEEAIFEVPQRPNRRRHETVFGGTQRIEQAFEGNVYLLPERTRSLPDLTSLESVGTVYTESIDIAPRRFDEGFPGISDRFEWFAVRYHGTGFFPRGGEYTFRLNSDDGSRLYIDGHLVVDNDGTHPPRSVTGSIRLSAGRHEVVVEYFQGPRHHIALQLFWTPPGGEESIFELPERPGRGRGPRGRGHGNR